MTGGKTGWLDRGMTIPNVWYEDLISDLLFNRLVSDLARAMGVRLRIRIDVFKPRQLALRAQLFPAITGLGLNKDEA